MSGGPGSNGLTARDTASAVEFEAIAKLLSQTLCRQTVGRRVDLFYPTLKYRQLNFNKSAFPYANNLKIYIYYNKTARISFQNVFCPYLS